MDQIADLIRRGLRSSPDLLAVPQSLPADIRAGINEVIIRQARGGQLTALAKEGRVYEHPNRFLVFPLTTQAGEATVRLHYWPDAAATQAEELHNHPWDFASVILQGELQMSLLELNGGDLYYVQRCHRPHGPEIFELLQEGRVRGRVSRPIGLTSGTGYFLTADIPHRIEASITPAVSVVVLGNYQRRHSFIYRRTREPTSAETRTRRTITADEARGFESSLLALLRPAA